MQRSAHPFHKLLKLVLDGLFSQPSRLARLATQFKLSRRMVLGLGYCALLCCSMPVHIKAASDKGTKLYEQEHYTEAKAFYEKHLKDPTHKPYAQYNLGCIAYQEADYAKAQEAFEAALHTTDPQLQEKAFYNLGNSAFQKASQPNTSAQEAIQDLEAAIKAYSNSLDLNAQNAKAAANRELAQKELQRLKDQAQSRQEAENKASNNQNSPKKKAQASSKKPSQDQKQDPTQAPSASTPSTAQDEEAKTGQNSQDETTKSQETPADQETDPKQDQRPGNDHQNTSSKTSNPADPSPQDLTKDTQDQNNASTTSPKNEPKPDKAAASKSLAGASESSKALTPQEAEKLSEAAKIQDILEASKKKEQKLHFQNLGSAGASPRNKQSIKDW
jgi:Ca-activated chloride channel homolog